MREENADHMKKNGRVVLLTAKPETIYERVKDSDERPILNGNMNVEYISGLMEKRKERYEAVADVTVATDGKNVTQICEEIIAKLIALDNEQTINRHNTGIAQHLLRQQPDIRPSAVFCSNTSGACGLK